MNTSQLIQVIQHDQQSRNKFCGVYSSDLLPSNIDRYPCGIIVNTDPHTEKGSHWLALYFPTKERGEFFDSYGKRPAFYNKNFELFLNTHSKSWTYNHRCLQGLFSSTCGQFCLYFVMNRNRGKPFNKIINSFSKNTTFNDHRVTVFVHRYLNFVKPKKHDKKTNQIAVSHVQSKNRKR